MRSWFAALIVMILAAGCAGPTGKTAADIQREVERAPKPTEDVVQLGRELGIEIFKSTAALDGGGMDGVATVDKDGVTLDAYRHTTESVDDVAAFYKARLVEPIETRAGGAVVVEGLNTRGERVSITANEAKGKQGGTLFVITVTRSAADQMPKDSP
jgi:hypothetical protein